MTISLHEVRYSKKSASVVGKSRISFCYVLSMIVSPRTPVYVEVELKPLHF